MDLNGSTVQSIFLVSFCVCTTLFGWSGNLTWGSFLVYLKWTALHQSDHQLEFVVGTKIQLKHRFNCHILWFKLSSITEILCKLKTFCLMLAWRIKWTIRGSISDWVHITQVAISAIWWTFHFAGTMHIVGKQNYRRKCLLLNYVFEDFMFLPFFWKLTKFPIYIWNTPILEFEKYIHWVIDDCLTETGSPCVLYVSLLIQYLGSWNIYLKIQ